MIFAYQIIFRKIKIINVIFLKKIISKNTFFVPNKITPSLAILSEPSKPPGFIVKIVPSVINLDSKILRYNLFFVFIISLGISIVGIRTSLVTGISILF